MSQSNTPRYRPLVAPSSRRTFLGRSAFGGLALIVVNACGGKSSTTSDTAAAADGPVATAAPAASSAPVETGAVAPVDTAAEGETTTTPAAEPAAGGAFGETSELSVSFTYVASGGGRVNNPYLAVWIEDENEMAIRTLLVSIKQGDKGRKWLRDLRRWYSGDQARIGNGGAEILDTISSPTTRPGTTDVVWDGTDDAGELVSAGTYYLCIEAAREHGPYDLIREPLSLTGQLLEQQLTDSGDLQQVTVSVHPRG